MKDHELDLDQLDAALEAGDLTRAGKQLAAHRALQPQPGENIPPPTLRFEELRARLPIRERPRWWMLPRARFAIAGVVAATCAILLWLPLGTQNTGREKGIAGPCGELRLRLGIDRAGVNETLPSRVVDTRDRLIARAWTGEVCFVAMWSVDVQARSAREVASFRWVVGEQLLSEGFEPGGPPGKRVLVIIGAEQTPSLDEQDVLQLLVDLAESRVVSAEGYTLNVDLFELEVE